MGTLSPLHGEELLHGGQGDVELLVVAVVVAVADGLESAYNGEADVVDGDGLTQHRVAQREQCGGLRPENHDAAAIGHVGSVDEAAFGQGHGAYLGKVRLDAQHRSGGVGPGADLIQIPTAEDGGDRAQLRQGAQGGFVSGRQLVGAHSGVLVGQSGNGGAPHHHHVVAEGGQLLVLAGAEALAQAHQHQQRADAPGDAEHGQEAAQLVGHDGAEDLAESVGEALHEV